MIHPQDCEFIVKVLLCHPTPAMLEDPDIQREKLWIKKRYREIRNESKDRGTVRFTEAEIVTKTEWLQSYLQNISINV
jgi:hypothetical protein